METPLGDGEMVKSTFFSSFLHPQVWKVCAFIQIFHTKFQSLPVWIHTAIAECSIFVDIRRELPVVPAGGLLFKII
jgi:hypothetical protein